MYASQCNQIVVASTHATVCTSTHVEITLPETTSAPPNAAGYGAGVVILKTSSTLGAGSGALKHRLYLLERISGVAAPNRFHCGDTSVYAGYTFTDEIHTKMSAGSIGGNNNRDTVTYSFDISSIQFERNPRRKRNSFYLVTNHLLAYLNFQVAAPFNTRVQRQLDTIPPKKHGMQRKTPALANGQHHI